MSKRREYLVVDVGGKPGIILWASELSSEPKEVVYIALFPHLTHSDLGSSVMLQDYTWDVETKMAKVLPTGTYAKWTETPLVVEVYDIKRPKGKGWEWRYGAWQRIGPRGIERRIH